MTGFARAEGSAGDVSWVWELRSVNARGLDLRFRLPPGWDGAEPGLREQAGRALRRGSVTAGLTLRRGAEGRISIDEAALERALELAMALHRRIAGSAPPQPAALLALPGVLRPAASEAEGPAAEVMHAAQAGFGQALAGLVEARRAEGARLGAVMSRLVNDIAALCDDATAQADMQPREQRRRMLEAVAALLDERPGLPEERIAQEVALLASRSDVREELDRLASHIAAARAMLAEGEAVGRRLDFLVQEFNREANTLCSKSATTALTGVGLRLKAAIERLREQVQNVE